jgi:hypothetical protein
MTLDIQSGSTKPRNSQVWQRHANDFYIEPAWTDRRLFEVEFWGHSNESVHDPACGIGTVVHAAREQGLKASGADIVDRGAGFPVRDFLASSIELHDNIVTNPPYGLFREFTEAALRRVRYTVCLLVPVARLNAARWLADIDCLRCIWLLTPRPSMPPGEVVQSGGKVGGGKADYCWLVFDKGYRGEPFLQWMHRDGPICVVNKGS